MTERSAIQVVADLMRELPPDTIAWRTISRTFTAAELVAEIEGRTEIGQRYTSDLLRISRDYLVRQARR